MFTAAGTCFADDPNRQLVEFHVVIEKYRECLYVCLWLWLVKNIHRNMYFLVLITKILKICFTKVVSIHEKFGQQRSCFVINKTRHERNVTGLALRISIINIFYYNCKIFIGLLFECYWQVVDFCRMYVIIDVSLYEIRTNLFKNEGH